MPVTLFTLYLIACMVGRNITGQQCKPSEVSIPGKALNGHTFKATVVSGPIQCQMLCENDPKCRSYNFHILTKNCELNDETKETNPNDFVTDDQRFYMKREDIDECKVFPFTCDVNADCHNTDSSYICTCMAGYTGDGKTCTEIDECLTGKHNCSHVAMCKNTIGSYNCTCKEGYVGDGRNCSDVDECSTEEHNCSHVAVCKNTIGSYNCTCQEGYVGDGRSCSDIDECSTGKYNCSQVAVCNNTIGSYNCTCKEGYVGDGRNCSDIDVYKDVTYDVNADCHNTDGSYICTCCPKNWVEHDKYCYKLASDRPLELKEAKRKCKEMSADLPIIQSERENTFIAEMILAKGKRYVWLGMERDSQNEMAWFDGTSAEKTNNQRYNAWHKDEPKRKPIGGDCAQFFLHVNTNVPKWKVSQCEYSFPFNPPPFLLCQKYLL
ncbi:protein kinase C-binding protein NELL2-like [Montipora capricornis]|uniref:protein kinase C-binding protein NELL2-like n=1 Tax=Montipora capricornis TaxID=246305 RepID=UPI0035F1F771